MSPPLPPSSAGLWNGLLGVVVFSATLPATRIGVEVFDPWWLTAARVLMAAAAAGLYLGLARRPLPARADLRWLVVAGLMLTFGFPALMAVATVTLSSAHGAVVMGILPLATAVAAVVFAGERPSLGFWIAALGGGALVVAFTLRAGTGGGFAVADLVLLAAVAAAAVGYAVSGKLARGMGGLDVIAWGLLIATPIALVVLVVTTPHAMLGTPGWRHWLALIYLGLFSQFLGFWWWNKGLAQGGVARVGQVQLLQTFFTLAIAAVLLGEAITSEMLVFAVLVALTVVVARRMRVTHVTSPTDGRTIPDTGRPPA